tara:strand:+ start:7369 stop:7575 length:207 start_codon:yes stop_codon:yes gene_type:complete
MPKLILIFLFFLIPNYSFAYIGPGMGGGFLAATIGIIIAIFAALFGILWFPVKRFLKKKKNKDQEIKK